MEAASSSARSAGARSRPLGPHDRRALPGHRQDGERAGRQEMLDRDAAMRLGVAHGADDAGLRIGPGRGAGSRRPRAAARSARPPPRPAPRGCAAPSARMASAPPPIGDDAHRRWRRSRCGSVGSFGARQERAPQHPVLDDEAERMSPRSAVVVMEEEAARRRRRRGSRGWARASAAIAGHRPSAAEHALRAERQRRGAAVERSQHAARVGRDRPARSRSRPRHRRRPGTMPASPPPTTDQQLDAKRDIGNGAGRWPQGKPG